MTLEAVRIAVAKQLGLPQSGAIQPASLLEADRIRLYDYTFKFIADNPAIFTESQVKIAKQHVAAWGVDTPLNDTSFDWGLLAREIGNNAVDAAESVAGVGKGVLNTFKLGSWLLPLVAIAVIAIFLFGLFKKQTR